MNRLTANFLTLLCFGIENAMSCRLWLCTLSTSLISYLYKLTYLFTASINH